MAAFRFYSACGCPNKSEIHIHKTHFDTPQVLDLLAVANTIEKLKKTKPFICKAVESVYFAEPNRQLHKSEINSRVIDFAVNNYVDERTVWRWLKEARLICAAERGLNTKQSV